MGIVRVGFIQKNKNVNEKGTKSSKCYRTIHNDFLVLRAVPVQAFFLSCQCFFVTCWWLLLETGDTLITIRPKSLGLE